MAYRPKPININEKKLYALLEKYGMTYAHFGKSVGYSRGYVSKIIQKQRPLTKEFTYRIIQKMLELNKKWQK